MLAPDSRPWQKLGLLWIGRKKANQRTKDTGFGTMRPIKKCGAIKFLLFILIAALTPSLAFNPAKVN